MKEAMLEALEEIENGMCRIKEQRSIWQNSLIYALCQAVRLLLIDKIKEKRSGLYSCSECGMTCPYDVQADAIEYWACNYCPHCGAKMYGGEY